MVWSYASTKVPWKPDYSTISRRVNRLEIKINEKLGNDGEDVLYAYKSVLSSQGYNMKPFREPIILAELVKLLKEEYKHALLYTGQHFQLI